MIFLWTGLAGIGAAILGVWAALKMRNADIWIGSYFRQGPPPDRKGGETDVYFCLVDHYEPYGEGASKEKARARVSEWCRRYPEVAAKFKDSGGRGPQHNYFYPEEEYDPEILDRLAAHCREGFGDVEVHLHHDNDTSDGFREKLLRFKKILHDKHGLLRKNAGGDIIYAFIHGNWALDNSRPDGRWCGVNDELDILRETGCYADFTLPSAPSDTQTKKINSIYFAYDDPKKPKSHDGGRDVEVGFWDERGLPIIQGPLTLNWRNRKWGLIPRIENAEVSPDSPPSAERTRLWARQTIHVKGAPDKIFIKVHTHGLQDETLKSFFDGGMLGDLYREVTEYFTPRNGYRLHFTTAWEMFETVRRLARPA